MNSFKRSSAVSLWALVVGCTVGDTWEAVCACVPAIVHFGDDLKLGNTVDYDNITPAFVAGQIEAHFHARHLSATLDNLRSIGPTFHDACWMGDDEIKCTFWLWHKGTVERGIEVNMPYCDCGPITGAVPGLKTQFVER